MASRTKLVFNALTSIAFYTFIVFLFLELYPRIVPIRERKEIYDRRDNIFYYADTGFIQFGNFQPIQALIGMLIGALIIGFIILVFTTEGKDNGTPVFFGNEERLEWMTYKFIPYLAYGIIGVVVVTDILRGVSHELKFGGRRRK